MQEDNPAPSRVVLAERYRLDRPLGRGGSGSVYAATDLVLGEPICVKVLHAEHLGDKSARLRFIRELALARRISHPSICRMHDYHEDEGIRFLTMEYIEGISLREALGEGNDFMPLPRALRILMHICEALQVIHEHGVIHRDLKAQNIMLRAPVPGQYADRICIVDFGIATADDLGGAPLTRPGIALGTRHYMAPEIWQGRPASEQSDLFAVGVLSYMLLTLRLPWPDKLPNQHLKTMRESRPEAPSRIRDELPRDLDDFIARALAIDPAERFQTGAEMSGALLDVLQAEELFEANTMLLEPESISSKDVEWLDSHRSHEVTVPEPGAEASAERAALRAAPEPVAGLPDKTPLATPAASAATGPSPRYGPDSGPKHASAASHHTPLGAADSASWVVDGHPVDSPLRPQTTEALQLGTTTEAKPQGPSGAHGSQGGGLRRGNWLWGTGIALAILAGAAYLMGTPESDEAPAENTQRAASTASPATAAEDVAPALPAPTAPQKPATEVATAATVVTPTPVKPDLKASSPGAAAAPVAKNNPTTTTDAPPGPQKSPPNRKARAKRKTRAEKQVANSVDGQQKNLQTGMKKLRAVMKRKSVAPADDPDLNQLLQGAALAAQQGNFEEASKLQQKAAARVDELTIDAAFVNRKLLRFNREFERVTDPGLKKTVETMGATAAKAIFDRRYREANETLHRALQRMRRENK